MFDEQTEQRMFEPHLCDDNIVVVRRKQSFVANKIVLTAFSWFSLLLFTQTKWLQQFELITEVLTSQSFNQILCFIYTSSLNVIACDVQEVVNIVRVLQTSHIANSCKNLIDSCASHVAGMAQEGKQCSQISPPFYCNADKELDLSTKIYPREGNKPYLVKVEDTMAKRHLKARDQTYYEESKQVEDVHGMEGDAEDSDDSDDQRSYNREQIIVEVNLNNQTLHVSKGAEGVSSRSEKNAMVDSSDGENEDGDDEEEDEEEEEDDIDTEDDGQDDEEIEDNIKHRKPKETTRMGTAEATPSRESTKIDMPEQRKRKSKDSKAPIQKGKQIEEKQNLTCEKCPRVFNNRWYLEKHMNVTHSRMQICDKCGKKFVLESELVLHQQTECEKNIQVG